MAAAPATASKEVSGTDDHQRPRRAGDPRPPRPVIQYGGTAETASPVLGAETEAILADTLGFPAGQIAALRDGGVFATA